MIQYWDTSALLKLYLEKSGSEQVRDEACRAVVCTHLIAGWRCTPARLNAAGRELGMTLLAV
ncbi:PIN domain-containing protein [Nitrococcus mobilis]|uniref:PIN domain-containing protein n=1 Tax=Nitrococcus mobilis Nb-231 TaxID=314278 RepID=A4BKX3_9GAMM|nr:hypothetical protein [Nitrococcus mobilis]EAR22961.1 hypothetical protein NB231_14113 [Nitrococcus mobilis Nb-231]